MEEELRRIINDIITEHLEFELEYNIDETLFNQRLGRYLEVAKFYLQPTTERQPHQIEFRSERTGMVESRTVPRDWPNSISPELWQPAVLNRTLEIRRAITFLLFELKRRELSNREAIRPTEPVRPATIDSADMQWLDLSDGTTSYTNGTDPFNEENRRNDQTKRTVSHSDQLEQLRLINQQRDAEFKHALDNEIEKLFKLGSDEKSNQTTIG